MAECLAEAAALDPQRFQGSYGLCDPTRKACYFGLDPTGVVGRCALTESTEYTPLPQAQTAEGLGAPALATLDALTAQTEIDEATLHARVRQAFLEAGGQFRPAEEVRAWTESTE